MTGEQLWASILQEAISGRLVPQLDSEPEVEQIGETPKDVPFEIPKKWKWVYLKSVIQEHRGGGTPSKSNPKYWGGDIPWASVKDLQNDKLLFTKDYITQEGLNNSASNLIPRGNIIVCTRMGLGKIVVNEIDTAINQDLRAIFLVENLVYRDYFVYFYKTISIQGSGLTVKGIRVQDILNLSLPLPPLQEQQRIVDRLNELKPLVDEYGAAHKELVEIESVLPERLKASLIQEAISGRLVPQLDSEPEVEQIGETPKGVPFEIPKKWKYVYLKYLTKLFSGTSYNKSDIQASGVRIIRGGNVKNFKVSLLDDDVYVKEELFDRSKVVRPSDIVIVASTGSYEVIGNPGEYTGTETVQIGAFLRIIRPIFRDYSEYLKVVFQSQYYRNHIRSLSKGTNIKNIKGDYIYLFPVPLPPLQEQQRIVDRFNELKPLVDEYGAAHKELVEIRSTTVP